MKIGVLTFHRSINNGAFIQCYSLVKKIQSDFPNVTVEVIDYDMPKAERSIYPSTIKQYYYDTKTFIDLLHRTLSLIKKPKMLSRMRAKKKVFQKTVEQLPLSSKFIYSDNTDLLFDYINNEFDIVIVGSDAVWNYTVRGFPNPYFLSDDVKIPKFFYAASCYGMNYENISNKERQIIKSIFDTYNFIGVRDKESELFSKLIETTSPVYHTCDPTVFLDVNDLPVIPKSLEKKIQLMGFDFSKKHIGIMGNEKMCLMVKKMFGNQYQIISLFNYCNSADVNLYDINQYEWAYIFRYFDLTFTTYFHGTLLSLRNGVPVICIALENKYTKTHISKVEDLLSRLDLAEWYFHTDYNGLNFEEIKHTAEELLNQNFKDIILKKLDNEAASYMLFYTEIKKIIDSSETEENNFD